MGDHERTPSVTGARIPSDMSLAMVIQVMEMPSPHLSEWMWPTTPAHNDL